MGDLSNHQPNIKFTYTFSKNCVPFLDLDVELSGGELTTNLHTRFFYTKNFYKKMSLKTPKTLGKYYENLQSQMPELQLSQSLMVPRDL